jgi:hypothetical protein
VHERSVQSARMDRDEAESRRASVLEVDEPFQGKRGGEARGRTGARPDHRREDQEGRDQSSAEELAHGAILSNAMRPVKHSSGYSPSEVTAPRIWPEVA